MSPSQRPWRCFCKRWRILTKANGPVMHLGGLSAFSFATGDRRRLVWKLYCGWLVIRHLWVRDDLRRRGVGRGLMALAEARAVERGCHSAWLDTFSFQARGFYEKLGYEGFGTLD